MHPVIYVGIDYAIDLRRTSFLTFDSSLAATMNPLRATSHYNLLVQAAETVKKELDLFSDDSDDDNYEDYLEREIWLLRSSLEYYYTNGIYPFSSSKNREDFCKNWVNMALNDYSEEIQMLRKKFKRVRKICKKFQTLELLEQEAFELGNKIRGSRRTPCFLLKKVIAAAGRRRRRRTL